MSELPLVALTIASHEFTHYTLWPDMYRGLAQAGLAVAAVDTSLPSTPVETIMAGVDGLVIGGGGDVDPALYGGDRQHPALRGVDPTRDKNELGMLSIAVDRGLPVLGVCRGAQLINVAFGGTLFHDLADEFDSALDHRGPEDRLHSPIHPVDVAAGSRLAGLLGVEGTIQVNSGHHQGIADVGDRLRVVATAPDGLVEAVEGTGDGLVVGVQWHPENLWRTQEHARRLLQGFAREVRSAARY